MKSTEILESTSNNTFPDHISGILNDWDDLYTKRIIHKILEKSLSLSESSFGNSFAIIFNAINHNTESFQDYLTQNVKKPDTDYEEKVIESLKILSQYCNGDIKESNLFKQCSRLSNLKEDDLQKQMNEFLTNSANKVLQEVSPHAYDYLSAQERSKDQGRS